MAYAYLVIVTAAMLENDAAWLGVIAIPKTATRSVEVAIKQDLPGMTLGPDGGCIYAPKSAALAAALPSTAYLQPNSETAETSKRANPDLFLFHCNYNEAMEDWHRHQAAFQLPKSAQLVLTTMLRDPLERLVSEFHFGIDFVLRDQWSDPESWRQQFWGQKDYTDKQLERLQTTKIHLEQRGLTRLEYFASQPWVSAHNRQTKFLAGVAGNLSITRKHLEVAKANLAKVDIVGLVEDVPAYLDAFACHFNLQNRGRHRPAPRSNARPRHDHGGNLPSIFLRDSLYRHSWADYELIAFARKLINERRARIPCQT